ncbi:hypothetical protein [Rhizobium leguminosarum]|uniref:hypothetical protein n=1 Tax=Rhizobium leguminosarum TaxID=384 RepID=UPI001C96B977|nr:hypothetical protein [Rhizobium leguminosarum]MBY5608724.1 hypothetical protein [Rhizobium leguminosarum]MBY5657298.1 hypothetical protein [Rhizobium leguminosarum]
MESELSSAGIIGSDNWQAYTWKNELSLHTARVQQHFAEYLDEDFDAEHSPFHMLEKAFVLCGFVMRRMMETRVVTDKLRETKIGVRCFPKAGDREFRQRWYSKTGPAGIKQYEMGTPKTETMSISDLGNEIIHASQLAIAYGFRDFNDGILIGSDWRYTKRLLHLTPGEFQSIVDLVLTDHVSVAMDGFEGDPADGKIVTIRK